MMPIRSARRRGAVDLSQPAARIAGVEWRCQQQEPIVPAESVPFVILVIAAFAVLAIVLFWGAWQSNSKPKQ
jgi:hypothetical protein